MNPADALQILDIAAGQAALNRDQHVDVRKAVQTLAQVIAPKQPAPSSMDMSKLSGE